MNTRKKRELAGDVLDNCSFKSTEPKKRKSNKKEPSAKPINLSSSVVKSSVEKIEKSDEKDSSVSEDASFLPTTTNPASIDSDYISVRYSYDIMNTAN